MIRNNKCRIFDNCTFFGYKNIYMENEFIRLNILIDKGASIYELYYKTEDIDFLWKRWNQIRNNSYFISTKDQNSGTFLDYYEGGWQECFPMCDCDYKGASFGILGEICNIPFNYEILEDRKEEVSIKFWTHTYKTPYYLERVITLKSGFPEILINEKVKNEGEEKLEFMWGHHPAISEPFLDENCFVELEASNAEILWLQDKKSYRFKEGSKFDWPDLIDRYGKNVDGRIIPNKRVRSQDAIFIYNLKEGKYRIINKKNKLFFEMKWDKKIFNSVWFWQCFGGGSGYPSYGRAFVIAIEPWIGLPAFGKKAIKEGRTFKIRPHEEIKTEISVIVGKKN